MPLSASAAAPATVQDLQLQSFGSPTSLQAWWGAAPGRQDSYQLLLYKLEPQMVAHNISMSPGTLRYNFSDLSPGSEYALEVTTWAATLQAKASTHQWTGRARAQQDPGSSQSEGQPSITSPRGWASGLLLPRSVPGPCMGPLLQPDLFSLPSPSSRGSGSAGVACLGHQHPAGLLERLWGGRLAAPCAHRPPGWPQPDGRSQTGCL